MSDKYNTYIGYSIKIKCPKCIYVGEIFKIDSDTIVLINATMNDKKLSTPYLGINQRLIIEMDIIKCPEVKFDKSIEIQEAVNVYTSETQPPIIKRGGSSSAVNRNVLRVNNNCQENMHKSKSSNFPSNNVSQFITPTIIRPELHCEPPFKTDIHISRSFNNNDAQFPIRRNYSKSVSKEPSWMNYSFNSDYEAFDFDSNLALFDKNALYSNKKNKVSESNTGKNSGSDSSDSGGLKITTLINKDKNSSRARNTTFSSRTKGFSVFTDSIDKFDVESKPTAINESNDVLTELKRMGVIPQEPEINPHDGKSGFFTDLLKDDLFNNRSFLQQPDIVQEVTKSQLCQSDKVISSHSSLLSIKDPCQDFQSFSDFWKLDNDHKFPVFTTTQKDKLFECANKFGYDIRTIADQVGKTLSDFVIQQIGGESKLSKLNRSQAPKVGVLLGRCQASVFVASAARCLLARGCQVLAFYDDMCHSANEDTEMEIKGLTAAFAKYGRHNGFNFLTYEVKDLARAPLDYVLSGLDADSNDSSPEDDLLDWCGSQRAPLLAVDPPAVCTVLWRVAAFVAVPTAAPHRLQVRTPPSECPLGFLLAPRTDGLPGLELDRLVRPPASGAAVLLVDPRLPAAVYGLLRLAYRSPFREGRPWVRLYFEGDLSVVE